MWLVDTILDSTVLDYELYVAETTYILLMAVSSTFSTVP